MVGANSCPQCGADLPLDAPQQPCPACLMQLGLESWAGQQADGGLPPTQAPSSGFSAPPPEELADKFPHLEILGLVGQGGMGAVYRARQKSLDRIVALKIIKPDAADDPNFAERFSREAKTLARLGHPNLVTVHDFGKSDGLYFFVMEYVDGVNLRQAMEAGRLDPRQALQIVPAICDALQYAHDEGIVHRDIKPENILLDQKGRVKIADFGLAKLLGKAASDVTLTGNHQVMGTLRYMAPEQMDGSHEVDHRADIYSLGVVFYELLTGEVPLGSFAPPSQKVEIDVRLDQVVLRALAREPEKRYQQASAVRSDVESIVQHSGFPFDVEPVRSKSVAYDEAATAWSVLRQSFLVLLSVVGTVCVFMPWTLVSIRQEYPAGVNYLILAASGVHHWFPCVASLLSLGLLFATLVSIGRGTSSWRAILGAASGLALVSLSLMTIWLKPLTVHPEAYSSMVTEMDEWAAGVKGGASALAELVRLDQISDRIQISADAFAGSWIALGVGLVLLLLGSRELKHLTDGTVREFAENPLAAIQGPAAALRVAGMLGPVALVLVFLLNMIDIWINGGGAGGQAMSRLRTMLITALAMHVVHACFVSPWIVFGASRMRTLRSLGAARTASVLAMLPLSFAAFVGLPAGVWSLLTLKGHSTRLGN